MQYKCNCTMAFNSEILLKADTITFFTKKERNKERKGRKRRKRETEIAFKIMIKYIYITAEARNGSSKQTSEKPSTYV